MEWLIALVVVSLLLAPIMWMMPTPKQKRQAKMREAARRRGLQVRITALPQTHREKVRKESPVMGVGYTRRLPGRGEWPVWLVRLRRDDDSAGPGDIPAPVRQRVEATARELPEDAVALECDGQALTVYWHERGDDTTVEQLADILDRIAEAMGAPNDD